MRGSRTLATRRARAARAEPARILRTCLTVPRSPNRLRTRTLRAVRAFSPLTVFLILAGAMAQPRAASALPPTAQALTAQAPTAQVPTAQPADPELRVVLITMGQGDQVWEQFGHNALLISDRGTGEGLAWNWGLFDFDEVDFIPRFLRGTMLYQMGPQEPERMLAEYRYFNRSVYANEVHLSAEEARALQAFVRWNYSGDNRFYTYDYFRDNCSTRVRDALDEVLDGAIARTFGDNLTDQSYRWHCRRLIQETRWIDMGLSYLLGVRGDRPRTEHEIMFIPMELMKLLETTPLQMADGSERSVLGPRETLFQADRSPTPTEAPGFDWLLLITGLVLGGGLAALAPVAGRGQTGARLIVGVIGVVWSLLSAALGWLLVFAWFTDHTFIHWNLNLLQTNPLSIAVFVLLPVVLWSSRSGRPRARTILLWVTAVIALVSVAGALLQLLPALRQGNGFVLSVSIPLNIALALVAWHLAGGRGSAGPAPSGTSGVY